MAERVGGTSPARRHAAMNLGVGGLQPSDFFPLFRDAVPLFRPADLIVVFYANDLPLPPYENWLDGVVAPQYARACTPRLWALYRRRRRGGRVAWRRRRGRFDFLPAVPAPHSPWSSAEKAAAYGAFVARHVAVAMKAGRFNPFVVNENRTYATFLRMPLDADEHLRALSRFCRLHGTRLWVVYLPSRSQVSDAYLEYQQTYCETPVASLTGEEYQVYARALGAAHGVCCTVSRPHA